jgi:hypothetical protein
MTKYSPSCTNLEDNVENLKLHKDSNASKRNYAGVNSGLEADYAVSECLVKTLHVRYIYSQPMFGYLRDPELQWKC